jgi:protein TonB
MRNALLLSALLHLILFGGVKLPPSLAMPLPAPPLQVRLAASLAPAAPEAPLAPPAPSAGPEPAVADGIRAASDVGPPLDLPPRAENDPLPNEPAAQTRMPTTPPEAVSVVASTAPDASPSVAAPGPLTPVPTPAAPVPAKATPARYDADYLDNPRPAYPLLSRRLKEEGRVMIRVLVSPEGQVVQLDVAQSSGFPRLDQAARAAVSRWRFVPARLGDAGRESWVMVPLSFRLDG